MIYLRPNPGGLDVIPLKRGGSRLRGEMNSDISSINLKITMTAYVGSICDYEKESES
jgi:hypothetical protein